MSQDIIPLLHTLTQRTDEGSVTEDSLLQLCEEHRNFHISICQCLEPYQPGASDAAYKWLFLWFSSHATGLRRYALQFIPPILSTYLSALYSPDVTSVTLKKRCEICLSALLSHLREPAAPSALSLSNATSYSSLYFYPGTPLDRQTGRESSSEAATPTRHADSVKSAVVQKINGSTRPVILPLILAAFTDELNSVSISVKLSFCRSVTIISASGLSDIPTSPYLTHCLNEQDPQSLQLLQSLRERQRIRVSQPLLIEMCQGLKFCLNRSMLLATLRAAECLYFRSLLEGMHQAMLCSNALLNLLAEDLNEEIREFELSSLTQVSTPVESAGDDATLEFEKTEHVDSTVV